MKRIVVILADAVVCFVASLFIGGFIFGMVAAEGCDWSLGGIAGRVFIGIVFAILTFMSNGFPPQHFGGNAPTYNAWPYILPTFVVLLAISLPALYFAVRKTIPGQRL